MTSTKTAKAPNRLRRAESLASGIRRIARQHIDAACRELARKADPCTAFHEARKSLKKLRALLQLVAPELGRSRCREEKQAFRDAAKQLGPLRDAEVRINTLDGLIRRGGLKAEDFSQLRGELKAVVTRLSLQTARPKRLAREILLAVRGRVQHWPLRGLKEKNLLREIRRAYRKGRKALRVSQQTPGDAEAFHAWRKCVKELWYHLRITHVFLLKEADAAIADIEALGELAGNVNDLAVLRETLSAHPATAQTALLIAEIDVSLPAQQKAALERGTRFYAEKPGEFARRLGIS